PRSADHGSPGPRPWPRAGSSHRSFGQAPHVFDDLFDLVTGEHGTVFHQAGVDRFDPHLVVVGVRLDLGGDAERGHLAGSLTELAVASTVIAAVADEVGHLGEAEGASGELGELPAQVRAHGAGEDLALLAVGPAGGVAATAGVGTAGES